MLNEQMFEILKNQFISNLTQDLLALSGFCDEDEILSIFEKSLEIVRNKFALTPEKAAGVFVDGIVKDALKNE